MSNKILEVDESIISKNLLLFDNNKNDEELENLIKNFESEKIPTATFRPIPGICIKTKTDSNEKVFINICHTTEIPPPDNISDEKFYEILDEEEPSWCVPMSIGHERFEPSKDGTPCLTYDIAINTNFFKNIQLKKHFLTFTILTMISAIESKHDKQLDSKNYIILKNRKVVGKLHDHRIQKREVRKPIIPKPLIEDISNDKQKKNIEKTKELKTHLNSSVLSSNLKYILLMKNEINKILLGYFKLPNKCCIDDVDVNITEDRIVVEAIEFNYIVDIFIPYLINVDKIVATMDTTLQILRLTMPITS